MKTTLCALAALGLIALVAPRVAQADAMVTLGGITYDISTVTTSFALDTAQLESTPWWGNDTLALGLAGLVGTDLGVPNSGLGNCPCGPVFAPIDPMVLSYMYTPAPPPLGPGVIAFSQPDTLRVTYAVGSVVTSPEPGSLSMISVGLLGLGLLVGVKRYRGNHLASEA